MLINPDTISEFQIKNTVSVFNEESYAFVGQNVELAHHTFDFFDTKILELDKKIAPKTWKDAEGYSYRTLYQILPGAKIDFSDIEHGDAFVITNENPVLPFEFQLRIKHKTKSKYHKIFYNSHLEPNVFRDYNNIEYDCEKSDTYCVLKVVKNKLTPAQNPKKVIVLFYSC